MLEEMFALPAEGRWCAPGEEHRGGTSAADLSTDTIASGSHSAARISARFHVENLYAKLHVHPKSEPVVAAIRRGIA